MEEEGERRGDAIVQAVTALVAGVGVVGFVVLLAIGNRGGTTMANASPRGDILHPVHSRAASGGEKASDYWQRGGGGGGGGGGKGGGAFAADPTGGGCDPADLAKDVRKYSGMRMFQFQLHRAAPATNCSGP